jgi:hypothetical protein
MSTEKLPQFDITVEPGADLNFTFNWYGGGLQMFPIEDIYPGYPTELRVTEHGLPSASPTPVFIQGVQGDLKKVNSNKSGVLHATHIDADHFSLPINTLGMEWEDEDKSGAPVGAFSFYAPTNLTGYEGRCDFRKKWHDDEPFHSATTENGEMVLTVDDGSISVSVPASITGTWAVSRGVFQVEVFQPGGTVVRACGGRLLFDQEVTR